jgi:hypothetical protein
MMHAPAARIGRSEARSRVPSLTRTAWLSLLACARWCSQPLDAARSYVLSLRAPARGNRRSSRSSAGLASCAGNGIPRRMRFGFSFRTWAGGRARLVFTVRRVLGDQIYENGGVYLLRVSPATERVRTKSLLVIPNSKNYYSLLTLPNLIHT